MDAAPGQPFSRDCPTEPHRPLSGPEDGGLGSLGHRWFADANDLPEPVLSQDDAGPDGQLQYRHRQQLYLPHDDPKAGKSPGDSAVSDVGPPDRQGFSALCRRKRFIVPLAVCITLLAVGGVLGGVLGTMLVTGGPSQSQKGGVDHAASILPSSRLAMATAGVSTSGIRIMLFQSLDGGLVSVEWQGSKRTARLVSNSSSASAPPKPLDGSPLQLLRHGPHGDLHLFYVDDALRFAHAVRRTGSGQGPQWEMGSLSAGAGSKALPRPSGNLRLSAALVPTNSSSSESEEYIVVMYQTDPGTDRVSLISSAHPDNASSWQVDTFHLGASGIDLTMYPESSGLLLLPVTRDMPVNGTVPGLRVLWDLANDSHKTTLGAIECSFPTTQSLEQCIKIPDTWSDTVGEKLILDAPKPFALASVHLRSEDSPKASGYIIRVLDHDGSLIELHGDGGAWTGHSKFAVENALPHGVKTNFTGVASVDNGLLYAVSGGRLVEFARVGEWWDGERNQSDSAAWKFLSIVDFEMPSD